MSSLFFWILILSILIPFLMRWHRRSTQGRDQHYFGGPGGPASGQGYPGKPHQQQDGFTQRDYFSGAFRQIQQPQQDLPPIIPTWQDAPPAEQLPPQYPGSNPQDSHPPVTPPPPPAPSGPQGFRARKLAELDAKFSAGELSMEDYMAQRDEIMKG